MRKTELERTGVEKKRVKLVDEMRKKATGTESDRDRKRQRQREADTGERQIQTVTERGREGKRGSETERKWRKGGERALARHGGKGW